MIARARKVEGEVKDNTVAREMAREGGGSLAGLRRGKRIRPLPFLCAATLRGA